MSFAADTYLGNFLAAYVECALWSSSNGEEVPLDRDYGPENIAPESLATMGRECAEFIEGSIRDLDGMDAERAGHDFWLTRNHHGAGFWDRGLGDVGARLTASAHAYGDCYLYVGDDGQVYAQ